MKPYISQRKIQLKIEMPPQHVDENWRSHLFLRVCHKLQGKCTQEHGYITMIRKIIRIDDQHISRINGSIIFSLQVLADCLLPKVGDCIETTIDMIFPHGVFCRHNMMRMMMPMVKRKHLHIRQEFSTNSLYDSHSKKIFRKGDILPVMIEDIRFEHELYTCIVSYHPNQNGLKT